MSTVSFTVLAHDLASRTFRGVGNAAMAMAAKVRAADAAAGNVGGMSRNVAMQGVLTRAYASSARAAGNLNRAMHFMTGGSMTPHARLWFRVILGGLIMMPALIGPAVVALGALAGAIVSVTPGAVILGAAMAGVFGRIKEVANGSRDATGPLRQAADALNRLKTVWSGFLDSTQGSVSRIFTEAFGGLADLLPRLVPMTRTFADVFTGFLRDVRRDMKGPEFAEALRWLERVGSQTFGNILNAGRNLIEFFYNLGRAFDAAGIDVTANWLDRLTDSWNTWAKSLRNSQGFRDFVDWVKEQWPKITEIAKNLGKTLANMFEGMKPLSSDVLTGLVHLTEALSRISPQAWEYIGKGFLALAVGSKALGLALAFITPAKAAGILSLGRLAFTPWGAIIAGIAGLTFGLYQLYTKVPESRPWFHKVIDPIVILSTRMLLFSREITTRFANIVVAIQMGWQRVLDVWMRGVGALTTGGSGITNMVTRVIGLFSNMVARVTSLSTNMMSRVTGLFGNMAGRVAGAASRIGSTVAGMASRVAGGVQRVVGSFSNLANRAAGAASRAVSALLRIAGGASNMAGRVAGAVSRAAGAGARLASRLAGAASRAAGAFARIATGAASMASRLVGAASRAVSGIMRIPAGATNAAGRVMGAFSRIMSGAARMAARIANAASNAVNRLTSIGSRAGWAAGAVSGAMSRIGSAAMAAADRIRYLRDWINQLRSRTVTITTNIVNTTTNIIRDIFRAKGGPVTAGQPYIVGEVGPELFVPGQSGTIVPNNKLGGGAGGAMNAGAVTALLERVTALLAEMSALREAVEAMPKRQMQLARQGGRA